MYSFLLFKRKRGKIKTRKNQEITSISPVDRRESLTKPKKADQNILTFSSKNLIKKNRKSFEEKESYAEIKPRL
jgi:hypothetical protein